jgi:hypothetical protein
MTVKRAGRALACVVTGVLVVTAPATASAQDGPVTAYVDAVDAWSTAARLQQLLPDSGSTGTAVRRAARRHKHERKATRAQLRRLRFTRRASVTERNVADVAAQLPGVDPATVAADIERNRALAHRQMRSFDGHWSSNNVADVAAFALLSAYAGYHDRSSLSARGSLAVLRAARNGLARSRSLRRVSATDKQTAVEMTEIRMIYALAALSQARTSGTAADVSIAQSKIRRWIRDVYKLDVDAVRLTRRGFASP